MSRTEPSRLSRITARVDAALGVAACLILFAMMALTFVDVFSRYLLDRSVPGSFEITEILMALLIFSGLPLVSRRGEHVTVDLVDHLLPRATRRAHRALLELVSGALLLGLGALLWHKALETSAYGDTTTVLEIRLGPFVFAMMAFVTLAGLLHLMRAFTPALHDDPRDGDER